MKLYTISDNHDTYVGLRLAGIGGVVVHTADETEAALKAAMAMEDVGIILITEQLVQLCPKLVYQLKLSASRPLIVEIPDRHAQGRTEDSISRYVREAIGVRI